MRRISFGHQSRVAISGLRLRAFLVVTVVFSTVAVVGRAAGGGPLNLRHSRYVSAATVDDGLNGRGHQLAPLFQVPRGRGMGGIRDHLGGHVVRATISRASVPSAVDLSAYNPPVANQGPVNSCSAWATMYYLRGWHAKRDGYYPGGPDSLGGFAPLFSYSQYSQKSSLGFNHGMSMDANRSSALWPAGTQWQSGSISTPRTRFRT